MQLYVEKGDTKDMFLCDDLGKDKVIKCMWIFMQIDGDAFSSGVWHKDFRCSDDTLLCEGTYDECIAFAKMAKLLV